MLMFPCMESIGGSLQVKGSRSPEVNPCPIYPSMLFEELVCLLSKLRGEGGLHCPNYNKLHLMTLMVEMIIIIIVTTT